MRNTLARQFAAEARRSPRMTKLEKANRENHVASTCMRGLLADKTICGETVTNVRYTDKGCSVDLSDGSTIAVRITAYPAD